MTYPYNLTKHKKRKQSTVCFRLVPYKSFHSFWSLSTQFVEELKKQRTYKHAA